MATETPTFKRDPKFGQDPWLNTEVTPTDVAERHMLSASRLYSGADALTGDIVLLPSNLDVYMSYVDNYKGWDELVARFGKSHAELVSITIFGNRAQCADVESGAMHASDLPHWLDNVADKSKGLPWVYTSAGNFATVNQYIGNRKVIRWSAHYTNTPHICGPHTCGYPQADWTQWAMTGPQGQNFDRSIGYFVPAPPTPPDPHHYKWFYGTFRIGKYVINERDTVLEYDRRRVHPILHRRRLGILKWHLNMLAGRVLTVAHEQPDHNGKPSWDKFHRGWRYQQLIHRAEGKRLV